MTSRKEPIVADELLLVAKQKIQQESRDAMRSERVRQSDLFLIRPDVARRARVKLKA
jgi:hypothetical protein